MNTTTRLFALLSLMALSIGFFQSCKNKDPSIVNVYVRSESNALLSGVKVILIGDQSSDPATNAFVDTVITNESGFATFSLNEHFEEGEKDYEVAYFDIIAKTTEKIGTGYIRTRVNTTAVETVVIQ